MSSIHYWFLPAKIKVKLLSFWPSCKESSCKIALCIYGSVSLNPHLRLLWNNKSLLTICSESLGAPIILNSAVKTAKRSELPHLIIWTFLNINTHQKPPHIKKQHNNIKEGIKIKKKCDFNVSFVHKWLLNWWLLLLLNFGF